MKIIIVGVGEVGFHIASRLAYENKDVVVIDRDPDALRRVAETLDVQSVTGSGSSPAVLTEAGLKGADIILAVTDSDEVNLVACLMAHILSPTTKKFARIRDADYDAYQEIFREQAPYIDAIINPEIEVVKTIERLMSVPGAVDVEEFAGGRIKLVGVYLAADAKVAGVRLAELAGRIDNRQVLIAAITRDEEVIIPHGGDHLKGGDLVYFICEDGKLNETLTVFEKHSQPVRRALIVGGGRIGLRLANRLEARSIYTKIIEKDPQRCQVLAENLNKTVVLCGDGSDQGLLSEENIGDIDVVVTLTSDEETNILASLLSRRMGASKAITKISKFNYMPLMSTIGIEQVVSARLSAINSILQHIRKGKVFSDISLKGEQAEVIEALALPTSEIAGKPLSKITFPKGALLVGIIRNHQIIIPSGTSVVEPDDRIIIFAKREAIPKVEKILTVKLEFF